MKKLTFHQIVWYFFVFSILGMLVENIFCLITKGVIESRKGFIIGPFCPIYGFGAIILLMLLGNQRKWYKVLFYGMIVGSSFEYISSYAMQALYSIKFWDYTNSFMNINGRTNLMYAFCWGILSLGLIYVIEPMVNKFIKKFQSKSLDYIILLFMIFNGLATYMSLKMYTKRINVMYQNLNDGPNIVINNKGLNELMTDEVMKKIFPNIIYVIDDENQVLVSKMID